MFDVLGVRTHFMPTKIWGIMIPVIFVLMRRWSLRDRLPDHVN